MIDCFLHCAPGRRKFRNPFPYCFANLVRFFIGLLKEVNKKIHIYIFQCCTINPEWIKMLLLVLLVISDVS